MHAKAPGSSDPAALTLIGATERSRPAGSDSISWVLRTNLPVKNCESAAEKMPWYGKRSGIEIWHKVLKSGCKVEDRLLEEAGRLGWRRDNGGLKDMSCRVALNRMIAPLSRSKASGDLSARAPRRTRRRHLWL